MADINPGWDPNFVDPFDTPAPQPAAPQATPAGQGRKGTILPINIDAGGNLSFDSSAGILGALKDAATLPADVMAGRVNPMGPEAVGRNLNFASFATPLAASMRAGERMIPGAMTARRTPENVAPPSAQMLKDTRNAQYDAVRDMGVDYKAEAVTGLAAKIKQDLEREGFRDLQAPGTFKIIEELLNAPPGSVASIHGLDSARKGFLKAKGNFGNPTEQEAARLAIDALDGFIKAADPETVVAGPAAEAARTITDARGNHAAFKRSEDITGLESRAELRAAAANSGKNIGNTLRQRLADILTQAKKGRGFSAEEKALIERAVKGDFGTNLARDVGNALGGGGGVALPIMSAMGAGPGIATGDAVTTAIGAVGVPALGLGARKFSNAMTSRRVKEIDEATRARSPLFEKMKGQAPAADPVTAGREALARLTGAQITPPVRPPADAIAPWLRRLLGLPDMSGT